jgi:hypothetical protein
MAAAVYACGLSCHQRPHRVYRCGFGLEFRTPLGLSMIITRGGKGVSAGAQLSRGRDAGTINHRSRGANKRAAEFRRGLTIMVMMGMLENETEGVDRKSVWRDKRDAAPLVGKNVKGNTSVVTWSVVWRTRYLMYMLISACALSQRDEMPLSSSKCSHRTVDGGPRRQNAQPMVRAVSAKCASMRRHSW